MYIIFYISKQYIQWAKIQKNIQYEEQHSHTVHYCIIFDF